MNAQSPISARLAVGLLLVSALSLIAYLVLSAYAPDLRSEQSGGGNTLSKSAVGFAGIRFLLEAAGVDSDIGRTPPPLNRFGLVVLTPEFTSGEGDLKELATPGPRLIVLPKWMTVADPAHAGWVLKIAPVGGRENASLLSSLLKGVKVSQRKGVATVHLQAHQPDFRPAVPDKAVSIDSLQTIAAPKLEPEIVDEHGNAVLAHIHSSQIYVLADPDLFDNMGLHDKSVAHAAFALLQLLRTGGRPISFDVTLNGFGRSPDLLRTVLSPPILGATLCAMLAAAFLATHALNRFGGAREPARVFSFGKRALADNTAAVIHLLHREPAMAAYYADAMLRLVGAQLGAPRERTGGTWVEAIERRANQQYRFAALRTEAAEVTDTGALMRVATKIYRWRRGILHESG